MPSRLALRIYAIGLVQFVVVALAVGAVHRVEIARMTPFGDKQARYVAEDLARVFDDPTELQSSAVRAASVLDWTVDVRDPDGRLVAHAEPPSTTPRPPPLPRGRVPIRLTDGRAASFEYDVHPPPRRAMSPSAIVGLVIVVVGVASFLTARSLARPLAQLASVARAFGGGQLNVRSQMDRRDEIGEVARAFDDMADRVANLLLAERELLANISHELRTPLARIRVALELASERDPAIATESFADITEDLGELERIVEDVLATARLAHEDSCSPASLPLRAEPIDTKALLDKSVARFRARYGYPLEADVPPELSPIDGDPVLVRRVIDNLLDNAHKYGSADRTPIELHARDEDDTIVVEVRDNGIGIAKNDLPRVFEPFFRADRSRTRATGGLGLGLALVKRVVDAHRGGVVVESEIGAGTTVRVRLPRVRSLARMIRGSVANEGRLGGGLTFSDVVAQGRRRVVECRGAREER